MRKNVRNQDGMYRAVRAGFLVLLALLALLALWRWKGETRYLRWTKNRQLDTAERLFRTGRLNEAGTAARRIVDLDPNNPRAVHLLAEIADRFNLRDAVLWRERTAELEPWNTTNLIEWAQTALRFQDYLTALRALTRYPTNPPPPAYYHDTAAAVALSLGDGQQADFHFSQAVRLDPTNAARQFNLAKTRLFAETPQRQEEARQTLLKLAQQPDRKNIALALLGQDALNHRKWVEAGRFSAELMAQTNLLFADRLQNLAILHGSRSPAYTNALLNLQALTLKSPQDLTLLLAWLNESGQTPLAMAWVRQLPADVRQPPIVCMAIADLFISLRDWLGLRNWVHSGDWPGLDCLRFAYDALAAGYLGGKDKSTAEVEGLWARAITAANGNSSQLELLAKIAARWGLAKQAEASWWAVADSRSGVENALMVLHRNYLLKENTLGQYQVARRLHALKPNDISALNNAVYLGLLLGVDDSNLQKLADRLHALSPKNPHHISTYAFALLRRGQAAAAVELMNSLDPAELRRPGMAAMHGVFLVKAGDTTRARAYLNLASQTKLLPEEEKMVNEARVLARLR